MLGADFQDFLGELDQDDEQNSPTKNNITSLNVPVSPLKSMNSDSRSNVVLPNQQSQKIGEKFSQLLSNIPLVSIPPVSNQPLIPVPVVQNIVSTCNLGVALNLQHLAMHARNAEYNPKRFAAVIMRIRDPRTTSLIFSSGKMVVTGAKSEDASRLSARKYARIVQKLGFSVKFLDFKLQNIVGSVDVKFAIQLEGLFITHNQFCTYEPELFPGLVYRMVVPRVVLLIFVSGKIVITGAKTREDIDKAFGQIYPIVKGFKK